VQNKTNAIKKSCRPSNRPAERYEKQLAYVIANCRKKQTTSTQKSPRLFFPFKARFTPTMSDALSFQRDEHTIE
jgi:hypothetical protein